MSAEEIKPMASLGSALLGGRTALRRVPLSFAPLAEITADADVVADPPEVVLQVARLAQALGLDGSGDPVDNQGPAVFVVGPRVAFTVRLDPTRHGRLRQVAASQSRSAQQVLVEAFDRYIAGSAGTASRSATLSSPSTASTGNQP